MGNKKNKKKKLTKWSKRNLHRIIAQRIKEQANSTKENADENNISTTELPDESLLFGESCTAKDTNETNQAPLVELHTVSPTLRESTRNNIGRCSTPLVELRTLSPGFFEREYSPTIEKIETSQASQLDVRTISSSPTPHESIITVTENVERCQTPLTELRTTLGGFLECETSPIENIDTNQAPLIELQRFSPSLRESDLFITEDNNTEGCRMPLMDIRATSSSPDETQATFTIEKENEDVSIETNVGRRLLDIQYFFQELQEISAHASLFKCDLSTIKLTGEKRIGLQSEFKFKCELCGKDFKISSDNPKHTDHVDVNTAACSGIVAAGIGYSQFEEICSAMDVPVFTERYFAKVQDQVFNEWEASAVEAMEKAAKREYDAAIAEGRVKDGIPVIDVYIDGAWSARSYGNNYRALSGVAAIIGRRFGEVLFIGVKNKYCLICARAEKKEETPKDHVCYKNYEGSSSSMEAAIICEGFKQSLEMYGLIYGNVIGDGDSSTYAKIIEANPYPNHVVSKIECRNHLLRNMCNKLRAITKTTKYPLEHRKLMTDKKIMSARKVITTAIKEKSEHVSERDEAIKELHEDISNSIKHAFGDHRNCKTYYCDKDKTFENSVLPEIENSMFWYRVRVIINSIASKSRSLFENVDTNTVERLNSVIAKFVGGKRINFSMRRSYQSRCSAAVVAFNTRKPLYTLHKKILGKSPRGNVRKYQEKREKKRILTNLATRKKNRKRKLQLNQNDYGERSAAPDMNEEDFKIAKEKFFERLNDLVKDRKSIEKKTILQRDSSEWLELRKLILTSSNFGKVIKRQKNHGNCVKQILYKKNISFVRSIAHGIENEQIALQQLSKQENLHIEPCGLYIDPDLDFLGASPDGTVGDDSVVEVKCPVAAHKKGMREAIEENKIQILRFNKKTRNITINKNSDWYFQAQGQLHVTRRTRCIFGIWGGEDQKMEVLYIQRDDTFWKNCMEQKLVNFYMMHMIPELVDSRYDRGMPLRNTSEDNSCQ